jgi:hypothetical protein
MKENKQPNYSGSHFAEYLALLFIALKLTGVIDWEWGWVLAPLWIPFVVVLGIGLPIVAVMAFLHNRN